MIKKVEGSCSTSPSGGNLVDGLPPALHMRRGRALRVSQAEIWVTVYRLPYIHAPCSTSLSDGNLVDSLPSASHFEN